MKTAVSQPAKEQKNLSFQGITSILKKKAFEQQKEIAAILSVQPQFATMAGSLPKGWIKRIDPKEKKATIRFVHEGISEAIKTLQKPNEAVERQIKKFIETNEHIIKNNGPMSQKIELLNEYIAKTQTEIDPHLPIADASKILEETLVGARICDRKKLTYAASGEFGAVYRLKADEDNFALKIFKNYHTQTKDNVFEQMIDDADIDDFKSEMELHGRFIEPNRALFWQHNFKKHQNAHMYIADLKNGGMLSKFITHDTPSPQKFIDEKLIGLEHTDKVKAANSINGWIVDGGGQKVINSSIASNANARKVYCKIASLPESKRLEAWNHMYNNKKANRYDVELGLMNAVELLPLQSIGKLKISDQVLGKWLNNNSLSYAARMELVKKKLFF